NAANSAQAAATSQTASANSATAAKKSETNSKASETASKTSETNAKNSEVAAESSQSAAANSATAAKNSQDAAAQSERAAAGSASAAATSATASANSQRAAKTSENNAKASETAAKTSETNAKSSETAAKNSQDAAAQSESAAAGSASAAAASATASANSQRAAKTSETNAKTSETAAANSAQASAASQTAAKASEDAAREYASQAAEPYKQVLQPLPDVWIPFNDSLDMITGFGPGYKKITVRDDVVTIPSDKIVSFSRASSATYINKSGALTIAEINEPRFEKEGLLIEGQRTNYLKNSNTPELWGYHSLLAKEYGVDNYGFNYATVTMTDSLVGTTSSYQIHSVAGDNRFSLSTGETCTFSARFRGVNSRCRVHVSLVIGENVKTSVDVCLEPGTGEVKAYGNKALVTFRSEKQGDWCYFETTYTAAENIDEVVCGFFITNPEDGGFSSDSSLTMTTPQIELGPCASSFIVSGNTPATRASDMVNIPITNNLSYIPVSCLVEVSRGWDVVPSSAPRIMHTIGVADNSEQLILAFRSPQELSLEPLPYAQMGGVQAYVPAGLKTGRHMIAGFSCGADGKFKCVVNGNLSTQSTSSWSGTGAATQIRFGGSSAGGERHLFGHVRNLRIWHKELTDAQMGESIK
ncbi:TPA: phage tail protein, partial [Escherichia coli]|nr:phage tail protein [Escherichia coli]